MNKKKILIITLLIILLLVGIPFIVFSNTERPFLFKDGFLIVREGDDISKIPPGTPMGVEINNKSTEQLEQEQRELQQKLNKNAEEQALRDFESGIIIEESEAEKEARVRQEEIWLKEKEEHAKQQQIFIDVMIRFYGKERIEKLEEQMNNETLGINSSSFLSQSDIEWNTLIADIVEYEKISDNEKDILKFKLELFWQNSRKYMPTELRERIQILSEISEERARIGME